MVEQGNNEPNLDQQRPPAGDSQPRPGALTNDNSNPQQGSGGMKSASQPQSQPNSTLPQDFKIPPTRKDARKLFVGGLPSDVTDQEFRSFFEQFGAVLDSVVMFDRETHRSRGFGFVTFVDPEVSKRLLHMGNHSDGVGRLVMRGKTCEVKAAQPKDAGHRGGGGGGGKNYRNDRRDQQKHFPAYGHAFHGFHPPTPVAYPPPPPEAMGTPMHPYPVYPPGVAGYMAPVYYPGMPHHPNTPPTFPPVADFAPPIGHVPPPYMMGQQEGVEGGQSAFTPPVPSNPALYASQPMLPMAPSVQMPYTQTSVMQPVAPGIPSKDEDGGIDVVPNT